MSIKMSISQVALGCSVDPELQKPVYFCTLPTLTAFIFTGRRRRWAGTHQVCRWLAGYRPALTAALLAPS